jgi:hypothetical protein
MRWAVLLLVLLNGLVWAWWQGHLSPLAEPPGAGEREPYRSARQLRPESVRVAGPRAGSVPASMPGSPPSGASGEAAAASAPASAAGSR